MVLLTHLREGALFGEKQEEACLVVTGPETMAINEMLNGSLVIEVGIAPARPAEFVIFRMCQET